MRTGKFGPGALLDVVIELCETDVRLRAYLEPAVQEVACKSSDRLSVCLAHRVRPREGLKRGSRRVSDAILERRRLRACPLGVCAGGEDSHRVVVVEGEDVHRIAWTNPGVAPAEQDALSGRCASDVSSKRSQGRTHLRPRPPQAPPRVCKHGIPVPLRLHPLSRTSCSAAGYFIACSSGIVPKSTMKRRGCC